MAHQTTMPAKQQDDNLDQLINALETLNIDKLKHVSYRRYCAEILDIAKRALAHEGTRLNIIIEHVKSFKNPCFQRDMGLEVLVNLMTSDFLSQILVSPFWNSNDRHFWNELACGITSVPDIVANCKAVDKFPAMKTANFYELLVDRIYLAIEGHYSLLPQESICQEHRLFLLKLLGRVAMFGHEELVWVHFTWKAVFETQNRVRSFCRDLLKLTCSPPSEHTLLEMFMGQLYLPLFMNLKPTRDSGALMGSLLGRSIHASDQLKYLLCDKSIFKANYNLAKERQAIVLFNIAGYLASLVTPLQPREAEPNNDATSTSRDCDNESESCGGEKCSLLIETLLEVVRSWTNATRILVRTYQHNKYITSVLLVLFRFALKHDRDSLIKHANEIQSMLARSIPIYLNRASPEQRNLASCLCQLILPKLSELLTGGVDKKAKEGSRGGSPGSSGGGTTKEGEMDGLNMPIAATSDHDDLLYLQQLFQQDVDVLFQDVSDTGRLVSNRSRNAAGGCLTNDSTPPQPQLEKRERAAREGAEGGAAGKQPLERANRDEASFRSARRQAALPEGTRKLPNQDDKCVHDDDETSRPGGCNVSAGDTCALIELNDKQPSPTGGSHGATGESRNRQEDNDEDLIPYALEPGDEDQIECEEDDNESEYAPGEDASNVPIYLRDCIHGLIESANRRYVRLCLIRAGALVDKLAEQESADATRGGQKVCSAAHHSAAQTQGVERSRPSGNDLRSQPGVSSAIEDNGVELARCLLFLENQFAIEKFSEYRISALVSLCTAAPQLIGKYLVDELNSSNRSLQIQLDLLHILVAAAGRLSFGLGDIEGRAQASSSGRQVIISSRRSSPAKKINKFVPFAPLFFYGISYRLKADLLGPTGGLITTQPKSVVSAFRARVDPFDDPSDMTPGHLEAEINLMIKKANPHAIRSVQSNRLVGGDQILKQQPQQQQSGQDSSRRLKSVLSEDEEATFLERNSLSDDSYLLSRILFSISRVLRCAAQQPSACRLSSDLLDILAAYRCHPDSGVQGAMVACLRMVRDCTPSAYYSEYIEKRVMHLFGAWLGARASSLQC